MSALQASGLIYQIFPLHETSALTRLQLNWVRKLFAAQPLDDIAEYFGVKVALYFAWLGHYTCALGVPAIFGIIMWAGLYGRGEIFSVKKICFNIYTNNMRMLYIQLISLLSLSLLASVMGLTLSKYCLYVCFIIQCTHVNAKHIHSKSPPKAHI